MTITPPATTPPHTPPIIAAVADVRPSSSSVGGVGDNVGSGDTGDIVDTGDTVDTGGTAQCMKECTVKCKTVNITVDLLHVHTFVGYTQLG